jgi:hypothetical protein
MNGQDENENAPVTQCFCQLCVPNIEEPLREINHEADEDNAAMAEIEPRPRFALENFLTK